MAREVPAQGLQVRALYPEVKGHAWWLQLDQIAQHSPASLAQCEETMLALAAKAGVRGYQGWDVEIVPVAGVSEPVTRQPSIEERLRARTNGHSYILGR